MGFFFFLRSQLQQQIILTNGKKTLQYLALTFDVVGKPQPLHQMNVRSNVFFCCFFLMPFSSNLLHPIPRKISAPSSVQGFVPWQVVHNLGKQFAALCEDRKINFCLLRPCTASVNLTQGVSIFQMSFENCGGVCRLVWHIPGVYLLQQAKFYLLISIISSFEFMYSNPHPILIPSPEMVSVSERTCVYSEALGAPLIISHFLE